MLNVLDKKTFIPIKRNAEWNEIEKSIEEIKKVLVPVYDFLKKKEEEYPVFVIDYSVYRSINYAIDEAEKLIEHLRRLKKLLKSNYV